MKRPQKFQPSDPHSRSRITGPGGAGWFQTKTRRRQYGVLDIERVRFPPSRFMFKYWKIDYVSCEGNRRWVVARCPAEWTEYDVENRANMCRGGYDDAIAEVTDVGETQDDNYCYDFVEGE